MERLTNSGTKEAKSNVTIKEIMDKLAHYEDLEEKKKLVILPCAVGDTVYTIRRRKITPLEISEISIFNLNGKETMQIIGIDNVSGESLHYLIEEIGKSVLTQEQAELALKEMEE